MYTINLDTIEIGYRGDDFNRVTVVGTNGERINIPARAFTMTQRYREVGIATLELRSELFTVVDDVSD